MIAVVVRTRLADLLPVLTAARLPVPVAAVVLDQPEAVQLLPAARHPPGRARVRLPRSGRPGAGPGRPLRLMAVPAGRHGARSSRDLRAADARSIVDSFLARMPGGGWLSADEADHLLRCYGIPMVDRRRAAPTRPSRRRPAWAVTW